MQKKSFTVNSQKGLSSRASAALVSEANKFKCELFLRLADETANLKSIMNVMGLIVKKGSTIEITCDGLDEIKALERIEFILNETRVI